MVGKSRQMPLSRFKGNIQASNHYLTMYTELRSLKGLGNRGRLDGGNLYLLWLPRAAVVASLSALDSYVHDVLCERIPEILSKEYYRPSKALCEVISESVKSKDDLWPQVVVRYARAGSGAAVLFQEIKCKKLEQTSYMSPRGIVAAYNLLGFPDILADVADRWQGRNTSRETISDKLQKYSKRRHQIVHESDRDSSGNPRPITREYVQGCRDFVCSLVDRLDSIPLPVPD